MAKSGLALTRYTKRVTILTSNTLNSLYGGLYNTPEGAVLAATDPLVAGHIHDGKHIDGHAQKINLSRDVTGRLINANLADDSVSVDNIRYFLDQSEAIPEFITIPLEYKLDLTDLRARGSNVDALFNLKAGYQWGHASISSFSIPLTGDLDLVGSGLLNFSIISTDTNTGGITSDGAYRLANTTSDGGGWLALSESAPITQGSIRPRLSVKMSVSVLDDARFFIGFHPDGFFEGDPPAVFSGLGDSPNASYVGFQYSGANLRGDTNWQVVNNTPGGTQTIIDTGIAAAIDAVLYFEIEYLTTRSVKFSIFDHTYTGNNLYTTTITVQPSELTGWFGMGAFADWVGGGTQDLLRFYGATLLNRDRSEA